MPLFDEYKEYLTSVTADMKNSGGRKGSLAASGFFLKEFAASTPWVQLDIAGMAWLDKEKPYTAERRDRCRRAAPAQVSGGIGVTLLFFVMWFVLVPSPASAWGPLTHCYLANELFYYGPLIPVGIRALLRKYRQDFLYGNLMADMILGKSYLPDEKSSHSWDVGLNLQAQARTGPERAFGLIKGQKVKVQMEIPIEFKLDKNN